MATKRRAAGAAIQEYLDRHKISQQQFAARLGVTQSLVSQWITGSTRITEDNGAKILLVTGGELTPQDLFPKLFLSRRVA